MVGNTGTGGARFMKTPRLRDYLAISLFWLPISLFWGTMLLQLLPERVLEFSGSAAKGTYLATISALGALASIAACRRWKQVYMILNGAVGAFATHVQPMPTPVT